MTVAPHIAGWRCACPRCGQGKLFTGYLKIAPVCTHCSLDLSAEDSADGPAVFLIFAIGFMVLPPVAILGLSTQLPYWALVVISFVAIIGLTLALLRPLKAYTVALQYKHRRDDRPGNSL